MQEENEWPIARTKWIKYYLGENNKLTETPPNADEKPDHLINKPGLKPGGEVPSLKYTTAPLNEDVEITGPSALYLYASLNTEDTEFSKGPI